MEVPLLANRPLGPIHSLIRDQQGHLFLSDEINHRIMCLTEGGELLWLKGTIPADPIQFRYPRGLAIGRVYTDNTGLRDCLAVCDSWNNRVVFLNLDGGQIGEWHEAGAQPLREVSDIRYVANPEWEPWMQDSRRYCWLLLDRGNHRLCWVESDGRLLAQVGQPCIPRVEANVRRTLAEKKANPGTFPSPKAFPPFNFLYYPIRFVGGPGNTLAVFEPLRNSLKLIHRGALFLLNLDQTQHRWLAFNDSGCLGWEEAARALAFIEFDGKKSWNIRTEGIPICADLANREWWEQHGQSLTKHVFVHQTAEGSRQILRNTETPGHSAESV